MHRRNMLWGAVSAIGATLRRLARGRAPPRPAAQARLKVVYHLNDLDKVNFVLGNIQNHLDGVGGPDHVTIALVVHGQALKAFPRGFRQSRPVPAGRPVFQSGLELAACG